MPELFTLADTRVLVAVMYQFFGTSWDLSLGNKKFLILLKYMAHTLRVNATDEQVQEYVDMVGVDMFWHVCDALWKENRLPLPDYSVDAKDTPLDLVHEMLERKEEADCHYMPGACMGGGGCTVGGCEATGDVPPVA